MATAANGSSGDRLGEVLLREGLLTREQLTAAIADQKTNKHRLGYVLAKLGMVPELEITKVLARGNRQVPEVAYAVCDRIGMQPKDLDLLVTNQPNRVFLRNWREALELPKERHVDTFEDCGNLFAAGIPVNLDRAISDGTLKKGDVVMMAAFAHAGDFAGAAAVKWGGRD